MFRAPRSRIQRPANTTAYGASDLIANDTDAADVVPLKWRSQTGSGRVVAVNIFHDDETVTNANFILHLFRTAPAPAVGDNGVFALTTTVGFLGSVACDMTTGSIVGTADKAKRFTVSVPIHFECETVYGLLATQAAYDPDDAEIWEVTLEFEDA